MTAETATPIHRPKVEYFNVTERTNTDPKGIVRPVDTYRVESWGLYMARSSDHSHFHYLESWIIPHLGIRVSIFHFTPGHERNQNFYIDIGQFDTTGPYMWRSVDHYLDLVVHTGHSVSLIDVDELLEAHRAGVIGQREAVLAIENATTAVDGIAAHGHRLEDWLASLDITLSWR